MPLYCKNHTVLLWSRDPFGSLEQQASLMFRCRGRFTRLQSSLPKAPNCALQVIDTVVGAGVSLAGVVGGGYHAELTTLAQRHTCLHRAAAQMWSDHGLS